MSLGGITSDLRFVLRGLFRARLRELIYPTDHATATGLHPGDVRAASSCTHEALPVLAVQNVFEISRVNLERRYRSRAARSYPPVLSHPAYPLRFGSRYVVSPGTLLRPVRSGNSKRVSRYSTHQLCPTLRRRGGLRDLMAAGGGRALRQSFGYHTPRGGQDQRGLGRPQKGEEGGAEPTPQSRPRRETCQNRRRPHNSKPLRGLPLRK